MYLGRLQPVWRALLGAVASVLAAPVLAAPVLAAAGAVPPEARPASAVATTAPATPVAAQPATQPATHPAGAPARASSPPEVTPIRDVTDHPLFQALMSVGLIAMLLWIVRRAASPKKLSLRDTPGRPNELNPLFVLAVLTIGPIAGGAAQWALSKTYPPDSLKSLVLTGLASQVASTAACLLAAAVAFHHGIRQGLGLNLRHALFDSGRGIVAMLSSFPAVMGLWIAIQHFWPAKPHPMLEAARELPAGWAALVVLLVVVVAPVSEELLFRGILQSIFRRYARRPWVGVAVAAGLFAAAHWKVPGSMPSMFVFGLVLGYNYERCGRLYPPILAHMLFNAVNMAINLTSGP